jgi:hypothetical protein
MRISYDPAQLVIPLRAPLETRDALPLQSLWASGDFRFAALDTVQQRIAGSSAPLEPAEAGRIACELAEPNGRLQLVPI